MKKKKGFTLIEIIICISLITIIGVSMTIVIVKNNKKKEIAILEKYSSKFENALQVYLSNHEEITYNLENNAKAAAITLEVLKNEGLIDKNMNIDYKKNYFLLSNAKLLEDKTDDEDNADCDNDVVGVEVFTRWDLEKNKEGKKVMYVCPKSGDSSSTKEIKELRERINQLEKNSTSTTIYDEENPDNYIEFLVNQNTSKNAYWNDTNLWRIYNYKTEIINGTKIIHPIKIVYSKPIITNYNYYIDKGATLAGVNTNQTINKFGLCRGDNCDYNSEKIGYVKLPCNNKGDGESNNEAMLYNLNSKTFYERVRGSASNYEISSNYTFENLPNTAYCKYSFDSSNKKYKFSGNKESGFSYMDIDPNLSGGKISSLYETIDSSYKNYIKETDFYNIYHIRNNTYAYMSYSTKTKSKITTMTLDEINIISNSNYWLPKLMSGAYLGINEDLKIGDRLIWYSNGSEDARATSYKDGKNYITINSAKFMPALTLNDNICIKSGSGTQNDPYKVGTYTESVGKCI